MTDPATYLHIRRSMTEALHQGICLLDALRDGEYNEALPAAFDASIGGHYRHCIEHFDPLLGAAAPLIDYDARLRDRRLETDRAHAIDRTRLLIEACKLLGPEDLARPVHVCCKVSYAGDGSPRVLSSLGREGMYAVVHAIHHYALIGVMCQLLGIRIPEGFGVAPSTAEHRRDTAPVTTS